MVLINSLIIATLIVTGQILWKIAVARATEMGVVIMSLDGIVKVLTNSVLLLGFVVYGVATLGYIYLLSKYNYFQVQSVVVGGSIILTTIAARFIFNESIPLLGYIGILCILIGVILVAK